MSYEDLSYVPNILSVIRYIGSLSGWGRDTNRQVLCKLKKIGIQNTKELFDVISNRGNINILLLHKRQRIFNQKTIKRFEELMPLMKLLEGKNFFGENLPQSLSANEDVKHSTGAKKELLENSLRKTKLNSLEFKPVLHPLDKKVKRLMKKGLILDSLYPETRSFLADSMAEKLLRFDCQSKASPDKTSFLKKFQEKIEEEVEAEAEDGKDDDSDSDSTHIIEKFGVAHIPIDEASAIYDWPQMVTAWTLDIENRNTSKNFPSFLHPKGLAPKTPRAKYDNNTLLPLKSLQEDMIKRWGTLDHAHEALTRSLCGKKEYESFLGRDTDIQENIVSVRKLEATLSAHGIGGFTKTPKNSSSLQAVICLMLKNGLINAQIVQESNDIFVNLSDITNVLSKRQKVNQNANRSANSLKSPDLNRLKGLTSKRKKHSSIFNPTFTNQTKEQIQNIERDLQMCRRLRADLSSLKACFKTPVDNKVRTKI